MDPATMRRLVEEARVAYFASVGHHARPHLVPLCFALVGDVLYSAVDAKPKRSRRLKRIANIESNPAASLLVSHYVDDWAALWWVRVDGMAAVVNSGGERDVAVSALARKYPQYAMAPPAGPVLALTAERWSGWSAAEEDATDE